MSAGRRAAGGFRPRQVDAPARVPRFGRRSARSESWRRDPRAGALVLVAGLALTALGALVLAILVAPAFVSLDVRVSAAIRDLEVPGLTTAARVATWVGSVGPMAALTGFTALVLALRRRRAEALTVLAAVVGGTGIGQVTKLLVERARPAVEFARIETLESYSFPSGHALASFLFFGSLAFVALIDEKRLGRSVAVVTACAFAALSVAMSRVHLGVHYLGDVIGGWLLGSAWLALVVLVSAYWGAGRPNGEPGPS